MIRALAVKELRESLGLIGLGLAGYLFYASLEVRLPIFGSAGHARALPFMSSFNYLVYAIVAIAFGIVLGLWQTLPELRSGTFLFLLHRPAERSTIFWTKLLTGLTALQVCGLIPILLVWWWAETPGNHASPFFVEMMGATWVAWLSAPVVYAGAFLTGMWPGRWFGTRPLPTIVGIFGFMTTIGLCALSPWGLLVAGVLLCLLVHAIFHTAEAREYP